MQREANPEFSLLPPARHRRRPWRAHLNEFQRGQLQARDSLAIHILARRKRREKIGEAERGEISISGETAGYSPTV